MNPILLLHGALGSKTQLEALKDHLPSDRIVYTLNFSGHSGEPYSSEGFGIRVFANDVFYFLTRENIMQVDIFGYSMGGYVALWLAHRHPSLVGKIITLGTKFDWNPESAEKEVRKMNAEKIEKKIPAFARILHHRHSPNDWKQLLNKTADMMQGLGQQPLLTEEILTSVPHPTTILLGDQDDMADRSYSQRVAELLPNGNFELLMETPHPIERVNLDKLVTRILS